LRDFEDLADRTGAPHDVQNRAPGFILAPHCVQNAAAPPVAAEPERDPIHHSFPEIWPCQASFHEHPFTHYPHKPGAVKNHAREEWMHDRPHRVGQPEKFAV